MFQLSIYLKKYKKECIIGPIFKFFEAICELLLPTIMSHIINNGVSQHDTNYVLKMGGLMVTLAVCGYICSLVCQHSAARASQGFGTDLRNAFFDRIMALSYSQSDQFGASTLTNRITNDINQLQQLVAMMIRTLIRWPFICIGSIVMSFFLDYKVALILLASTPILTAVIYLISKNVAPLYRSYQKKLDGLAVIVRENLSGIRVIRAFSKTLEETRRFNKANQELMETGLSIGRISSLFNPLTTMIINIVIVFILWAGVIHIHSGRLDRGQIVAFIQYANQILLALLFMSNLIILITKSMACANRVKEVMNTQPDMENPQTDAPVTSSTFAVEFQNVSFGHDRTGDRALENINVAIKKGETIGLIGGTGSGKTTFVNLIARFYDATSGTVLVNGVAVKQYPLKELRKKIAIVSQHALLFTGTILENIRWGNAKADIQSIKKAAEIAQADEFIQMLPNTYNYPVQRGGANLSGGQRQRLTIARAVIADSEILILDDASSALDFLTDSKLRKSIRESGKSQTVLLISQRVGTIRDSDRIFVFDNGRIVGTGTHNELYHNCNTYREICHSQLSNEEVPQ